jgi:hypothetical protein
MRYMPERFHLSFHRFDVYYNIQTNSYVYKYRIEIKKEG